MGSLCRALLLLAVGVGSVAGDLKFASIVEKRDAATWALELDDAQCPS
jgi:hypothetical protein